MDRPVYLDYNATTPVGPEVLEAMLPYLTDEFGNPSSSHPYGVRAKRAVEKARVQLARLLGCDTREILFTSGGSESNNTAIKGVARAYRERGNHIITSAVEHPAVLEVCGALASEGFETTTLPVDRFGRVDPADVEAAITSETILITIMHANNEVGTIQPIAEIARLARDRGILFHTDAAQSIGKIPVRTADLGVDLLSVAGHKFYGPKGIGALYIRNGVRLEKVIHGADHEANRRAGTESVPCIVGLGVAAESARAGLEETMRHTAAMRDRLEAGLKANHTDAVVNGHPEERLPNTLSISFPGVDAGELLARIGPDVAASAGAACHSDGVTMSHVLEAMGVSENVAMGTIRFSTGRMTTEEEIDTAIRILRQDPLLHASTPSATSS